MYNRDLEYKSNGNIAKLTAVNKHRLRALRFFIENCNRFSKDKYNEKTRLPLGHMHELAISLKNLENTTVQNGKFLV